MAEGQSRGDEVRSVDLDELAFMMFLMRQGYEDVRPLPDGQRWAATSQMLFTTAILTGRIGDEVSVEGRWCYETREAAAAALDAWDGAGEPEGWHRAPHSGRRRWGGDSALEYLD